uniref:HDC16530 n=1 Tax=Drosophila melanogaster TaxID=7227 RepID=Q6IIY9_DROME|nr:TPA_inf: HDC16530 [Drosophila melanogaster]
MWADVNDGVGEKMRRWCQKVMFGLAEHFPFLSLYTRRRQLNGRDYAIERVMRNKFDILSDCVKL